MTILVVETQFLGHHSEYLDIIISYVVRNKVSAIFMVNKNYRPDPCILIGKSGIPHPPPVLI